jgi:hypothetical protein
MHGSSFPRVAPRDSASVVPRTAPHSARDDSIFDSASNSDAWKVGAPVLWGQHINQCVRIECAESWICQGMGTPRLPGQQAHGYGPAAAHVPRAVLNSTDVGPGRGPVHGVSRGRNLLVMSASETPSFSPDPMSESDRMEEMHFSTPLWETER